MVEGALLSETNLKPKIRLLALFSKLNGINTNLEKIREWTQSVKPYRDIKTDTIISPLEVNCVSEKSQYIL